MSGERVAPARGPSTSGVPLTQQAGLPVQLGEYCLLQKIAEGGMAEVFLARRFGGGPELFAIKRLHHNLAGRRQFIEMFDSEGQVATLLHHPNIVRTFCSAQDGAAHFICMEYLSGKELRDINKFLNEREQRLPVLIALWIVEQILEALDYSHQAVDAQGQPMRLVNRDVSPTNVLITFQGEVKLIDFGIAQTTMGFTSQIGHIKGKIAYMSPEQVRGLPVDQRSDVFSAAIILHELLTGRRLFVGDSDFALMEAVRSAPIPQPSSHNPLVEAELDRIVMTALARDVADRYGSARELQEALARYRLDRGLHYGKEELGHWLRSSFPDQHRQEAARLLALQRLNLPEQRTNEPTEPSPSGPLQPTGQAGPPVALLVRRPLRWGPVIAGVALGLALSAVLYWLIMFITKR